MFSSEVTRVTPWSPRFRFIAVAGACLTVHTQSTLVEPLSVVPRSAIYGAKPTPGKLAGEGRVPLLPRAQRLSAIRGRYKGRFSSVEEFLADRHSDDS